MYKGVVVVEGCHIAIVSSVVSDNNASGDDPEVSLRTSGFGISGPKLTAGKTVLMVNTSVFSF